ncbi:MAG: PQQ-binding-like beta-propeller repeat protein [Candidatus Hydrogenedentota bacterium]
MSDPPKRSIPGPVIAVGLIASVWLGSQIWPLFSGDKEKVESSLPDASTSGRTITEMQTEIVVSDASYQPEGGSWSTYHGGPALTGVVDTNLPDEPELLWRFQADASVYYAPVSTDDGIFFNTSKGGVFALDFSGNELWSDHYFQEPYHDGRPRVERFDAPISAFESTVLMGAMRGLVYALDAATGEQKWIYDIGGPVLGTANFHDPTDAPGDERIFIIEQGEGVLHSIALATGEGVWKTPGVERCDGSPSIKGNAIIYGSCAAALHVFSAKDGSLVKDILFDEDSQVAGGAAIVGDSAYVGTHSGRLFHASLNAGEVIWVNEDSLDEIFETPAVNRDYVVFSSYDGSVYALNRDTGKLIWSFETDGTPTSPVIAGDKVVITTDGILVLLRLATGEEIWSIEISDETSSPAIINGMIVVGSDDGTVSAYGNPIP